MLAREADALMAAPSARADRAAMSDEIAKLHAYVARLERDLARASRCLAAERLGRSGVEQRLRQATRDYDFSVRILTRLAFPAERE